MISSITLLYSFYSQLNINYLQTHKHVVIPTTAAGRGGVASLLCSCGRNSAISDMLDDMREVQELTARRNREVKNILDASTNKVMERGLYWCVLVCGVVR